MNIRPEASRAGDETIARTGAASALENTARRPVLTGIGVATPIADDVAGLCDFIAEGRNAFTKVARFDTSWCETDLACAYDETDDRRYAGPAYIRQWMDRAVWYLLDALDRALDDAGVDLSQYEPERIAVVLGTSHSGLATTEDLYKAALEDRLEAVDPRRILAIPASHIASVVAATIGAKGVRRTVSSACASSTGAMGIAADLIRTGEADAVITGGTDTVSLAVMAGFNSLRALAKDGCQPFSNPPGITLGEGAGVFVLERLDTAMIRGAAPRAEILGYALSGDAHHATAPDENGDGIRRVLTLALADAGVGAGEIDYLSAHGTGTDANDFAESRATAALFGTEMALSTSKSIFGHTLGASGAIETALTIGMAERGLIPPTLGLDGVREGCVPLDYVPNEARRGKNETFICNNYGFGGNNASVIFRRTLEPKSPGAANRSERRRVVVSGAGIVNAAGAAGVEGLCASLEGETRGGTVRLVADDRLPAVWKRQVGRASPMVKFAVSATGEALAAAGVGEELRAGTGLVFSVVTGAQRATEKFMESVFVHGPSMASAQHFPHTTNNAPAGQVSICHELKGYNTTLCGTAGAMGYAIDLVADARQDRVVAAGADEHSDLLERFYSHAGIIRDGAARAFDGKPGINFGEGSCAIVFEDAEAALARGCKPYAEVLGYAECQDGVYSGVSRRGDALARAIGQAVAKAGLRSDEITRAIVAGSGPGYFANAEVNALASAFGANAPRLESPVDVAGYGPSHTPLTMVAASAVRALQTRKPVLCASIDLTGVAFAAVLAPVEDGQ